MAVLKGNAAAFAKKAAALKIRGNFGNLVITSVNISTNKKQIFFILVLLFICGISKSSMGYPLDKLELDKGITYFFATTIG